MTDTEWMELLQQDSDKAMHGIMEQYAALVKNIVSNRLSGVCSREDVEECVNDVFTELYLSAGQIDLQKGTVKGWLCAIAKHKATDRFREASKQQSTLSLEDEDTPDVTNGESAEDAAFRNARSEALTNAILSLGEPDREIIVRRFYYRESSASVAGRLGMTAGTVDTRVSRALKKLRKILEKENHS